MKKLLLILLFFLIAPQVHASPGTYSYYIPFTVSSNTNIASSTQQNFPMLASTTQTVWKDTSHGGHIQNLCTAPNGGQEPCDLIFSTSTPTASGGLWTCANPLNFETESYASTTGALVDWVNIQAMQASDVIYACYGASSVNTDQSNPTSTWNTNYAGVWHLPNNYTTLGAKDSTSNANNGTLSGTTPPSATTGQIDGAGSFDGSTGYIDVGTMGTYSSNLNVGTVSVWVKTTGTGSYAMTGTLNATSNDAFWRLGMNFDPVTGAALTGAIQLFVRASGNDSLSGGVASDTGIANGSWHNVVATWNKSAGTILIYLDGNSQTIAYGNQGTGTSWTTWTRNLFIGGGNYGSLGNPYQGSLDELRINKTALPSSWITTEYNNQSSPSTFYTVGSETSPPATSALFPPILTFMKGIFLFLGGKLYVI